MTVRPTNVAAVVPASSGKAKGEPPPSYTTLQQQQCGSPCSGSHHALHHQQQHHQQHRHGPGSTSIANVTTSDSGDALYAQQQQQQQVRSPEAPASQYSFRLRSLVLSNVVFCSRPACSPARARTERCGCCVCVCERLWVVCSRLAISFLKSRLPASASKRRRARHPLICISIFEWCTFFWCVHVRLQWQAIRSHISIATSAIISYACFVCFCAHALCSPLSAEIYNMHASVYFCQQTATVMTTTTTTTRRRSVVHLCCACRQFIMNGGNGIFFWTELQMFANVSICLVTAVGFTRTVQICIS